MLQVKHIYFNTTTFDVIAKLQQEVQKAGLKYLNTIKHSSDNYIIVTCPYHKNGVEHKPSAQFRLSDGLFYCHACKKSTSIEHVIEKCLDIEDGTQWLKQHYSHNTSKRNMFNDINIYDKQHDSNTKQAHSLNQLDIYAKNKEELKLYRYTHPYMFERKLNIDIIRKFDIGYDSKTNCITFPNKDRYGNILFYARRSVSSKYFNFPKDVDKPIYGLYEVYREIKNGIKITELYICESMLDALFIWTCGKYAIALNGLGSASQIDALKRINIRSYILATDNDKHGKNARNKLALALKDVKLIKEIDYKSYSNCKDINDMTEQQFLNSKIQLYVCKDTNKQYNKYPSNADIVKWRDDYRKQKEES